jgi:hypothetical protein
LVGWALTRVVDDAVGPVAAAMLWLLAGLLGLLLASNVGAHRIAGSLDRLAGWLADEGTSAGIARGGDATDDDRAPQEAACADKPGADSSLAATGARSAATSRPPSAEEGGAGVGSDAAPSPSRAAAETGTGEQTLDSGMAVGGGARSRSAGATRSGSATDTASAARGGAGAGTAKRGKSQSERASDRGGGVAAGSQAAGIGAEHLPSLDILGDDRVEELSDATLAAMGQTIERSLASFGVPVEVVETERGPSVTRFCVAPGTVETRRGRRRVKVAWASRCPTRRWAWWASRGCSPTRCSSG